MIIYKYPVGGPSIKLPVSTQFLHTGLQVLHNGTQNHQLYVWAMVDTDPLAPQMEGRFRVIPTGEEVKNLDHLHYIGTVFEGIFVWHIFWEQEN